MKQKLFVAIALFILTIVAFVPVTAGEGYTAMASDEFDRWPFYPEYTVFNFFPSKGRNCTWYAHGRMMQLGYCKYTLDSMRFNANTWAGSADRGAVVTNVPQPGSIAFWDSGAFYGSTLGHVGVVEQVRPDGAILVSDSSSSAAPYRVFLSLPGDDRWPTAFILVPEARPRSEEFIPGTMVKTTADGLNFRPEGINQTSISLPTGTVTAIRQHSSNGIYSSRPGSFSEYHYWWYSSLELDGEVKYGWLAETYLMAVGFSEPEEHHAPEAEEDIAAEPEPEPETDTAPVIRYGDVSGTGMVNVIDVTLTMQHIMNIKLLGIEQVVVADVNGDGLVNVLDVVLITQKALGLIDSFPCREDEAPDN
jgi:surface antigen